MLTLGACVILTVSLFFFNLTCVSVLQVNIAALALGQVGVDPFQNMPQTSIKHCPLICLFNISPWLLGFSISYVILFVSLFLLSFLLFI